MACFTGLSRFPDVGIVYPVYLNPSVQQPLNRLLAGLGNIYLIEPREYLPFVYLIGWAHIVLTDFGGVQEEAPLLGEPVLAR
jgi:UDP-N-acetylglucosamine 2-epimerase (non-hydrolysing)